MRWMTLCVLLGALGRLASGAETEIVFRQDFEEAPDAKQWAGTHETEKTFSKTKGAMKCTLLQNNQWFGGVINFNGINNAPLFKITDQTWFHFCYFTSEAATIKVTMAVDDVNVKFIAFPLDKVKVNEWAVCSVKMTDFKDGFGYGKKQPPGLSVKTMSFNFGKPNSKEFNWLDNVLVTEGEIVGDFDTFVKEGAAAAKAKAERIAADKAAQTLTLAEHQVLLSPEAIDALKRSYKPDGVTAHLIMTVGADAAKALDHWTPLTRKELKDCKIVDKFSSTLQNADMEKIKARALEALAKFKPETVTILPGTADLAMNKTPADVATQISELADAVIEAGAVPILYTPAISNRGLPAAVQAYKDLAEEVRKLAVRRKLPLVDAFAIINPDGVTKMSWVSGANPNMSGHEAINKASLLLYARLDQYLYGRKPGDAGGAKEAKSGDGKHAGRVADEE